MHEIVQADIAMAKGIALRMARRVPSHVDHCDLIGAAYLGLVNAARCYDVSRGASWKTYAFKRVRGAVLDWMRSEDMRPRFCQDAPVRFVDVKVTIHAALAYEDRYAQRIDAIRAVVALPVRERFVVIMKARGFMMKEIARLLGVCDSRVSQLWTAGARRIRARG